MKRTNEETLRLIDRLPGWEDRDIRQVYTLGVMQARLRETCVEVGSWFGKSSAYLGLKCAQRGGGVHGLCIDTWRGTPGHPVLQPIVDKYAGRDGSIIDCWKQNIRHIGVEDYVAAWQTDSLTAADEFAAKGRTASGDLVYGLKPGTQFPFVFLDDDHSEEHVARELVAWTPLVRPGGIIAGHDYDRASVREPVGAFFGNRVIEVKPRCWMVWV